MRSRVSRRLPFLAGTLLLWLYFVAAHGLVIAEPGYTPFSGNRGVWSVVFLGGYLVVSYASGLPDLPRTRPTAVVAALLSISASIVMISAVQLLAGSALLPRWTVGGLAVSWPVWALVSWLVVRDRDERSTVRCLYVGHPDTERELAGDLAVEAEVPAELVARLSLTPGFAPDAGALLALAAEVDPDVIVLDALAQADADIVAQAAQLHGGGMRIRTPSLLAEEHLGKIPLADLERTSLLFDVGELHRIRYVRAKRIAEFTIAAVASLSLLVAIPVVVVGNRLGNRGPLFYHQPRVGKGGQEFVIHKFRTMRPGGDSSWTADHDDRITRFGGMLRRSHLDELPQLWNILRGDLSLVGPRPEQPRYVEELCEKIPYFATRNLIRPGLTGWAQVKAPYASSEADAREKLQYDLYYLRRQSAVLDARILLRTLRSVFRSQGR